MFNSPFAFQSLSDDPMKLHLEIAVNSEGDASRSSEALKPSPPQHLGRSLLPITQVYAPPEETAFDPRFCPSDISVGEVT